MRFFRCGARLSVLLLLHARRLVADAAINVGAVGFVYAMVPETKGLALEQISAGAASAPT